VHQRNWSAIITYLSFDSLPDNQIKLKMALDKLLDNCETLEKTISVLIKSNAAKQMEVIRLQNCVFDESQASLNEILNKENDLHQKLDDLKFKKNNLDTEIKQYSDINEKLSNIVSIVQSADQSDEEDNECKNEEMNFTINDTLEEYGRIKQEFSKINNKMLQLVESLDTDKQKVRDFIFDKQILVADLNRNDASIRLFEQQNKFSEQQFDLFINQLPWEPLTTSYLDDLKKSHVQAIRDLADTLQLQKNEIEDLTESLNLKKAKKLKVLEELYSELNDFVKKREEAVLVTRVLDG
jgi:hypothetical protein